MHCVRFSDQDTSHFILHSPATDFLRHSLLVTSLSFTNSGLDLGKLP